MVREVLKVGLSSVAFVAAVVVLIANLTAEEPAMPAPMSGPPGYRVDGGGMWIWNMDLMHEAAAAGDSIAKDFLDEQARLRETFRRLEEDEGDSVEFNDFGRIRSLWCTMDSAGAD